MVDFSKGIYTAEFEYEDIDGVKQSLKIRPLTGKHYKTLMKVLSETKGAFSKVDGKESLDTDKMIEILGSNTSDDMHELCLETLKKSYPTADVMQLEEFVSSHMLNLFFAIVSLNLANK